MNESILIIEDNSEMQELLRLLLEKEGYHILSVTTGKEAIEKLRQHPILMLILMDLTLPDIGIESMMNILQSEELVADIPIVYFSAIPNLSKMTLPEGVVGIIQKPFQIKELLDYIAEFRNKIPIYKRRKNEVTIAELNHLR